LYSKQSLSLKKRLFSPYDEKVGWSLELSNRKNLQETKNTLHADQGG
jgi:hypothetical protein